jgi:acyl-CoA thioesterase-1
MWRSVNAGVSGDTASDGLARLEWSVPADADIVIVELGANDACAASTRSSPATR